MRKKVKGEAGGIGLPLVLYAWISGTAAKIAAAGKKAAAKPSASKSGAVKSGAASAIKSAAKKAVTATKNTVSSGSRSPAKTDWQQTKRYSGPGQGLGIR